MGRGFFPSKKCHLTVLKIKISSGERTICKENEHHPSSPYQASPYISNGISQNSNLLIVC